MVELKPRICGRERLTKDWKILGLKPDFLVKGFLIFFMFYQEIQYTGLWET